MLNWSELDEKRFNLKTVKHTIDHTLDFGRLVETFRKENGQLFIVHCDTTFGKILPDLFESGFIVTDTVLKYSIKVENTQEEAFDASDIDIEVASHKMSDDLGIIASKAFHNYRGHYHNNPRLDNKLCDEVYVDWAKNLVLRDDMADAVFVCRHEGVAAGFASLQLQGENRLAIAGLLCVDPAFEGRGIARLLHQKRFEWCRRNGIEKFQIETSINNRKYINLLTDIGYKFQSGKYVLHLNNF